MAVDPKLSDYLVFHDETRGGGLARRREHHGRMVNDFYDLVTDFYEFGWGESFHFAVRHRGESHAASIARHQFFLALRLELRPGLQALDVGCGVGGPMRAIARFSGATVVGVNNNDYQVRRGIEQTRAAGLEHRCRFVKGDFMEIPPDDGPYDAVYAIEATCHAPDKIRLKRRVEEGDALPELTPFDVVIKSLGEAGLEIIDSRDVALECDPQTPWYQPLAMRFALSGFRHSRAGRIVTNVAVRGLEMLQVAPRGSAAVSSFLNSTADAIVRGGATGIFTPMFYVLARKPVIP